MDIMTQKRNRIAIRHRRVRAKISGTALRPRFSVFRSNQHIYGQLIDDEKGKTLASVNDSQLEKSKKAKKSELAKEVGLALAKKAVGLKIKEVVFDRGGFKYHGRIKQLAEGAREGGLAF